MKKLRSFILSFALILGCLILPGRVYADSLNIGVSGGGNFNVGDTFTVTISAGGVGGNYVAEGALTYDPSVLSVAGMGGSIPFVVDNGNVSTSVGGASITFTCLKAGSSGISISGTTAINVDTGDDLAVSAGGTSASVTVPTEAPVSHEANLTSLLTSLGAVDAGAGQWTLNCAYDVTTFAINPGVSAGASWSAGGDFNNLAVGENHFTITVTAQDGVTSRSYPITVIRAQQQETTTQESSTQESSTQETTKEETSESETESEALPDGLTVSTTDGQVLYVLPDLSGIEIPEGAEVVRYTLNDEEIQAVELENGLILLYLTDEAGENGAFYVYNMETGTAIRYNSVGCSDLHYVILPMAQGIAAPFGYHAAELTIDGITVDAFVRDDIEDLYLVYARDENGHEGLFRYDAQTGSFMRYESDPGQSVTGDGEGIASLQESYIRLSDQYNRDMRTRKKQMILLLIPSLLFLAAAIYCLMKWMHGDDFPPENPFRPRDPEGPSDDDVKEVDRMLDEEIGRAKTAESARFSVSGREDLADTDFALGAIAGFGLAEAREDEEEIPADETEAPAEEAQEAAAEQSFEQTVSYGRPVEEGFDDEFVNGFAEVMAEVAAEEAEETAEQEVTTEEDADSEQQSEPVEELSEEEILSREMNEALEDFFGEPVEEPMEILPAVEAIPVISEGENENKLQEVGEIVEEESEEEFAFGDDLFVSLVPDLTDEDLAAARSAQEDPDPLSATQQIFLASDLFTTKVPTEEVRRQEALDVLPEETEETKEFEEEPAEESGQELAEEAAAEPEEEPAEEPAPSAQKTSKQIDSKKSDLPNYGFVVEDLFDEATESAAREAARRISAKNALSLEERNGSETDRNSFSMNGIFGEAFAEEEGFVFEEIVIEPEIPVNEVVEEIGGIEDISEKEDPEIISGEFRPEEDFAVDLSEAVMEQDPLSEEGAQTDDSDESGFNFSRRSMYGKTLIDGVDIEEDIDTYLNAEPAQKTAEDAKEAKEAMKAQRNAEPVVQMTVLDTDDFEIIEL